MSYLGSPLHFPGLGVVESFVVIAVGRGPKSYTDDVSGARPTQAPSSRRRAGDFPRLFSAKNSTAYCTDVGSPSTFRDRLPSYRSHRRRKTHRTSRQATAKMPPKKVYVQPAGSRRQPKGFFASTYDSLTSPENSSMVKAIAAFGVSSPCNASARSCCRNANLLYRSASLSSQARGASSCFLRKL